MNENKGQADALLAAGIRDQTTLRLLRQFDEAPHETMGFHAQQACEKFLKAVLVSHGIVFERTHDLVSLFGLCASHGITIPVSTDTLRPLNTYAVTFRYEGCPVAMINMEDAAQTVATLFDWAKNLVR